MKLGVRSLAERASSLNKLVFFWLVSIFLVATVTISFLVAVSHLVIKPLHVVTPAQLLDLAVEIAAADPIQRTFTMDWFPVGRNVCITGMESPFGLADIFINDGYLDSTTPTFEAFPPYSPVYQYNATAACNEHVAPLFPTFRTVSKIIGTNPLVDPRHGESQSSLQQYPFDVYYAPVYVEAVDHATGKHIGTQIARSFGAAVNFDIQIVYSGSFTTVPQGEIATPNVLFVLEIRRSMATKVFVLAIAVTDWLVAIAFVVICASTTVFHHHDLYTELFVLPVGAVFALTSVRANFPGAPVGFGMSSSFD
ncbi:hypothetical protein R3P38DRAFT_2508435 [Favolaschia claudopus]|uniref:Uncharacterized protein n=1 Tax=Favolaschia claudopus TaxID=2862362 RepID=A0AAW0CYG3_9AGAR